MERVDLEGDQPMVGSDEQSDGQKIDVLTARFEAMSTMMMGFMTDNKQQMDAIMMSIGPQGALALEMGAIKEALKEFEEKNEVRFKKLEEIVYKNKQNQVRFDGGANKKRIYEEINGTGDTDMGGASAAGSSKDGGAPGFLLG